MSDVWETRAWLRSGRREHRERVGCLSLVHVKVLDVLAVGLKVLSG